MRRRESSALGYLYYRTVNGDTKSVLNNLSTIGTVNPLIDKTAVLVMGPLPLRGPLPNHKTDSFNNHLLDSTYKTVNPINPNITLT